MYYNTSVEKRKHKISAILILTWSCPT